MLSRIEKDTKGNFNLPLIRKNQLSHDTWMLEYGFGEKAKDWYLGLNIGGHLNFNCEVDGKVYVRQYAPISPVNEKGKVDFITKAVPKTPENPNVCHVSDWLVNRPIGHIQSFS